ncbi:MAG: SRPBCC domain-containing protein [Bacteroidota bacterium]
MQRKNNSFELKGNELIYTRLLNAPRELVWEAWTDPEHLKEWWGPDGFTITNKSMKLEKGSEWKFVMSGHGYNFDERIEYLEIVKPSLLKYRHHDDTNEEASFTVFVNFEDVQGKTLLTMRSVFQSAEVLAELNRQVNAIAGGTQTLDKMEKYVNLINSKN